MLVLLLWPYAALAGEAAPQMQDTLNTVVKRGEVIVGTFDFFAPWGFRDAQNNIVGMDVDIAKEFAGDDVLKVKLTLVPVPTTQDRINFLLSGKIDVAISNFTATLPRSKAITFSDPYVIDGIGAIYRKEAKIKNWSDLNGKKVAVTTGSTGEILLKKEAPKAIVQQYDQASTALLAVQQGKADAQIEDYTCGLPRGRIRKGLGTWTAAGVQPYR
jgi:polar amino acid transport system substrate-binding protein